MAKSEAEAANAQRVLRITDIIQESLEFLAPIGGYENMPLVSLEKAVEPLVSILPAVQSHAYVAKQKCKKPADELTQDESASIMLYTMGWEPLDQCLYVVLNDTLRSSNRQQQLRPWYLYLRLFLNALYRLPPLRETTYRGVKADMAKGYNVGDTLVWWGFSSCTVSVGVLESNLFLGQMGARTMFTIQCETGRNIYNHSFYPSEDEILLLAASQFKVTSRLNQGDLCIIQLKETQPPFPLLQPVPIISPMTKSSTTTIVDDSSGSKTTTKPLDSYPSKVDSTAKETLPTAKVTDESKSKVPVTQASIKKSSNQHSSSHTIPSKKDILVYIPDIPSNLPENDLEKMLQTRLKSSARVTAQDIKCDSKLGIAVIRLSTKEDKEHLVSNVQSMLLDPKRNTHISFAQKLEFESYIVIDRHMSKIPSSDNVLRYFMQAYKLQNPITCNLVSVMVPNIFRIVTNSLDDIITVANSTNFNIKNTSATVYSHAECSFFQDLPSNTTDDKLLSAIAAQIGDEELLATSFHVQFDKKTGIAVILALKSVKQWITQEFLIINEHNILKREKPAYRVLVAPIPRDFDIDAILYHTLFADHIETYNHINDHLILELDDTDTYNHCLSIGAVRIDDNVLKITEHFVVSDPETPEIDAETWYETDMKQIKPDIMSLINDHHHPIFQYQWNAKNWLEQFKKVESTDRYLLRVTVMLNTIGVARKQRYMVDKNEVILKHERMRTIVYNHASKLSTGKKVSLTKMKAPYPSTTISVVNQDCLVLYERLVKEGYRPLLLNMADATTPGGDYRKGGGSQEENLFRRSDYYQSLDIEVADKDQSERLYCTSKYDLKKIVEPNGLYPMEEFGAIYTSGITVFRQTEAQGYAFMEDPLYNVCAIAMAAFRNPELSKNNKMLANKFAVATQKKIENIFAIAHHHKHNCLVLSALGCGALKNPPAHVASIFKSVILQYAGFFKKIYFAIVDDHHTGNRTNPQGNFLLFKDLLDGLIMTPPSTLRVDAVFGPNRILNKSSDEQLTLSDVCILNLRLCPQGSKCNELRNSEHNTTFLHPPMCPREDSTSSCDQMDDETHVFTFTHNDQNKQTGDYDNTDPEDSSEYDHSEFCQDGGRCGNMHHEHLLKYQHVPLCQDGIACIKFLKRVRDHCNSYRHCKTICPYDNGCVNFHDKVHIENTIHSFRPPCPFTPYNCAMYVELAQGANANEISPQVEQHCLTYSHVCLYGSQCKMKNPNHLENTIHIARQPCPDQDRCPKLSQEDHLESFSHPDIRDIRLFCKYPGFECRQKLEVQHLKKYRHGRNDNHVSVALSGGVNASINFVRNHSQMIKNVNSYVETSNWTKAKISPDILNWIRALQPIHRCGKIIFESILVHGHVMSRDYMDLLKKPKYVARAVQQHSRVRLIFLKYNNPALKQNAKELITILVEAEFAKAAGGKKTSADADHDQNTNKIIRKLKPPLTDNDIKVIHDWSIKIAQASIKLHETPMGIGYEVDHMLGTDKQVFSILGPHRGYYYGDIIIIFKQELMLHPDSNFSIQAGTSFPSGSAYKHRPWLKDPVSQEKRVQQFHTSKLHCSVARYEYAAAAELVALAGLKRKSMNVSLQDVLKRWMDVDSHEVFESHLPQLIPLDYIDCVYMPQNVFDSLTPEAQQSAKGALKKSLIITSLKLDLSLVVPGKIVPLDTTREAYLKYITGKICEKIEHKIDTPSSSKGIMITAAASRFEQQIIIPITISQAYSLYCVDKSQTQTSPGETYIYWQAMNGDMMLTISNEQIQTDKDQTNLQCLVCYVAEKPPTNSEDYHEAYSYLNDGQPCQHDFKVGANQFKVKSNRFYCGCNTDDFFTFCLKINHKTGQVTLSHAGPNSIYNHQKIQFQFDKSLLDLTKSDFIYVSAGAQDVPIRNLTINFEPILELHPSFDKNFKLDTSFLLKNHHNYTPSHVPSARSNSVMSRSNTELEASTEKSLKAKSKSVYVKSKDAIVTPSSKEDALSTVFTPCRESVYCLQQNSFDHTAKYSHPCRFNELCRNKATEPHLVHERHNVSVCSRNEKCSEIEDPVHRAKYRHTNLPDYLVPCRYQNECYDKSSKHRIKYFHGEALPSIKKSKQSTYVSSGEF